MKAKVREAFLRSIKKQTKKPHNFPKNESNGAQPDIFYKDDVNVNERA